MQEIRVGDVVRVTSELYEDGAIEGTVTRIIKEDGWAPKITVTFLWNNYVEVSPEKFNITVLRQAEPEAIGSTVTVGGMVYTKFTNDLYHNWINTLGETYNWKFIERVPEK